MAVFRWGTGPVRTGGVVGETGWPRTDRALFGAAGPTHLGGNRLGCSRSRVTVAVVVVVVVEVDAPVFVVVRACSSSRRSRGLIDVVQQQQW